MKKKLILVGILCLGLIGCSNTQPKTNNNLETITETTASETIKESESETQEVIEKRENTTFRNAIWGDDIETVKRYETEIKLEEADGSLMGEAKIAGLDSYVIYMFDSNGKLYQGLYGIKTKEGVGEGIYISDFNNLKENLTKLYGTPISDEILPLTSQSQIDYTGPENSLKFGYTAYRTIWNTNSTEMMLGMQSQDYKVSTVLTYTDINYEEDLSESGL